MNEILITVYVLSLQQDFDIFLPIGLKMGEALNLIQNMIYDLSLENYEKLENPLLYSEIDGKVINTNNIVKFSGLKNGSRVLLK